MLAGVVQEGGLPSSLGKIPIEGAKRHDRLI
jgi:hypothetical protein